MGAVEPFMLRGMILLLIGALGIGGGWALRPLTDPNDPCRITATPGSR